MDKEQKCVQPHRLKQVTVSHTKEILGTPYVVMSLLYANEIIAEAPYGTHSCLRAGNVQD